LFGGVVCSSIEKSKVCHPVQLISEDFFEDAVIDVLGKPLESVSKTSTKIVKSSVELPCFSLKNNEILPILYVKLFTPTVCASLLPTIEEHRNAVSLDTNLLLFHTTPSVTNCRNVPLISLLDEDDSVDDDDVDELDETEEDEEDKALVEIDEDTLELEKDELLSI
jgi:hypothetical protein